MDSSSSSRSSSPKSCSSNSSSSPESSTSSKSCYPTTDSEAVSLPLFHKHLMIPFNDLRKGDCCGRFEAISDAYYCQKCDFFVHKSCAESSESIEHLSHPGHALRLVREPDRYCDLCERESINDLYYHCDICDYDIDLCCAKYPPLTLYKERIHEHPMIPFNDLRKGDCCGGFEAISDGYYCKPCDFFIHKNCANPSDSLQHPSHPAHTLQLRCKSLYSHCDLCGRKSIGGQYYWCGICKFDIGLCCAKYPPQGVIDISETHHHKLTLFKRRTEFDCAKCGDGGYEFPYKCHECDLSFHGGCIWHPEQELKHLLEVNHSYHSLHPLKLHASRQLPDDYDGKCRLCERKIKDRLFYHCPLCNFTVDMRCVFNPPLKSLMNLKAHDHQLTLLPRLDSFTCNACGLKGDRSPYTCFECGFMIHQDCLDLPRVININRHNHRVSRISVLGVVDSVCGVCRKKVDRTCGGFCCQKCVGYVVHSECATRWDVWNGKELEGIPEEEEEDIEPYVEIDEKKIQHFSHKEHYLRLHVNDVLCDENKLCRACTHPICLQSYYGCDICDFILHQNCAGFLRKKRHFLHNDRLTLATDEDSKFNCKACDRICNGFRYKGNVSVQLDVRCISISEPFIHPSHPDHPLYYTSPDEEKKRCNGCNKVNDKVSQLSCIELNCEFVLCFQCATLPFVVKHRVYDHPLSLCYGEKESSTNWCDICEKESDPEKWFYTCKDHRASMHIECVVGDFSNVMPGSKVPFWNSYNELVLNEMVLNNSVSRPICSGCKLHCIYPIIVKSVETIFIYSTMKSPVTSERYFCSYKCLGNEYN